jgi:signal transduction histidine kinase
MAAVGVDSLRVLRQTQATNSQIHRDFLARERTLEHLRTGLYQSGSTVRDYILFEPGQSAAEALRAELQTTRQEMDAALQTYARLLRPEEKRFFEDLRAELETYWWAIDPVLQWDAETKREQGYWFLRQQLFPRRATVLSIARNIAEANERALNEGERRVAEVFAEFARRLSVMTAIGLGLGLVVALLSVSSILRLERNLDLRYRESLRAHHELQELSARLVEAQEQERRSISRELHDEVGQSLSALLMDAGHLAAPGAGDQFRRRLEELLNVIRNISLLLRPSMLDDLGLVPALEWQAREVSKRTGMLVEVVEENVSESLPEDYKTCVYRVVQEALHNASRHAQARRVRIVVRQEPERILLTIQDDGKGFDARRVRGLGLLGMSERASHLGGAFYVDSQPGHGVLLRVELPLGRAVSQPVSVAV